MTIYLKLYDWLTLGKIGHKYETRQAHSLIVTTLSTSILMWAYTLLAFKELNHPIPVKVGIIASIIHLASPLLLKWPGSIRVATHVLISAGFIHQATFSYFSGGFNSQIVIWFGILPMIGGIILGRIGVLIWATIATSMSLAFILNELSREPLINYLSSEGSLYAQGMIVFGWIFLSTVIIYVFILQMERHEQEQSAKTNQIRTLINVLYHDILNPLTTTTTRKRLDIVRESTRDEEVVNNISKIDRPLRTIQSIIDQIRNWENIESGKLHLVPGPVNLTEKNLKLECEHSLTDPVIYGEKTIVQSQILSNIFSNAIKFSKEGSSIKIQFIDDDEFIFLNIKDYGLGIPPELMNCLFDPNKKTSLPGTKGEVGTGFGLPIVKSYIVQLGGDITVSSKFHELHAGNSGSTFSLKFKKYV